MSLPPEFLEEVRDRLRLSEIVGRRVRLQRRGHEHVGLCPFHREKTPSFTVTDAKGFYYCFGCGAHGDAVSFVMQTEALGFLEAVEALAGEAGLAMPRVEAGSPERREARANLMDLVEEAARLFERSLAGEEGASARAYLERRGISKETVRRFRLGYAPAGRGRLLERLRQAGTDEERIVAAGLAKRREEDGALREYFFDRLIFPITDRRGRVVAFGGRTLGDGQPKYLNSPESELFHKGHMLYNLAQAREAARASGELVVVEGYMDVLALAEAGLTAAVAPLGTAVTESQIKEVWRLAPEPVICLDGDNAGERAALRLVERALPLLASGHSLRFALLPPGEDPDSFVRALGIEAMRERLAAARPLTDLVWHAALAGHDLTTPERRAAFKGRLRALLARVGDPDLRREYQRELDSRAEEAFERARGGRRPRGGARTAYPADSRGPGRRLKPLPAPEILHRRQEQLLLALLLNHPQLMDEHVEEIGTLQLRNRDLEGVLRAVLDTVAAVHNLDTSVIKRHLSERGYDEVLRQLDAPEVYSHGMFARPNAPEQSAAEGFDHLLAVLRERAHGVGTEAGAPSPSEFDG